METIEGISIALRLPQTSQTALLISWSKFPQYKKSRSTSSVFPGGTGGCGRDAGVKWTKKIPLKIRRLPLFQFVHLLINRFSLHVDPPATPHEEISDEVLKDTSQINMRRLSKCSERDPVKNSFPGRHHSKKNDGWPISVVQSGDWLSEHSVCVRKTRTSNKTEV